MNLEEENIILNKDYVIPNLMGRIGNCMFTTAAAYAYALEHNKQLVISRLMLQNCTEGYDHSQELFRKFDFIDTHRGWEDGGVWNPVENPPDGKYVVISGFYQDVKHFEKYSEPLKSMFSPPDEFVNEVREKIPEIFEKRITAVHVRRGDYIHFPKIHPTVTPEYVSRALSEVSTKTDQVLIMSDDVTWCKNNIEGAADALYIEEWKAHEQIWIMSLCHNFVLSNSTFGWWGAYLSRQSDKTVVAPSTWFGPDGPAIVGPYDIDWIILPTYFHEDGLIYPVKE